MSGVLSTIKYKWQRKEALCILQLREKKWKEYRRASENVMRKTQDNTQSAWTC